jgi:tetratricopeptide (TPR) repeat protein
MRKFTFILVLMAALLAAGQAWTADVGTFPYYYEQGMENLERGNVDQAIRDFTKVIETHPRLTVAYCGRGLAYFFKGQYDQAITDFNRAQEINPRDETIYVGRARAYLGKGQYDQALEDFRKAQSLGVKFSPDILDELRKLQERIK